MKKNIFEQKYKVRSCHIALYFSWRFSFFLYITLLVVIVVAVFPLLLFCVFFNISFGLSHPFFSHLFSFSTKQYHQQHTCKTCFRKIQNKKKQQQQQRLERKRYKEGYVVVIFNWIYDRWVLFHHHHLVVLLLLHLHPLNNSVF